MTHSFCGPRANSSYQACAGSQLQLPHQTTPQQLETLLNGLLKNDESVPYAFYLEGLELNGEIGAAMLKNDVSVEKTVEILFRPQAVFRVRPVGRCTATMAGALLRIDFGIETPESVATGVVNHSYLVWRASGLDAAATCVSHRYVAPGASCGTRHREPATCAGR